MKPGWQWCAAQWARIDGTDRTVPGGMPVSSSRLRDQLSSLIGRRDGIIHRAYEISETELDSGIGHGRRFIEQLGEELLELNRLE